MANSEVCQHCSKEMRPTEAVSKEGYSYHKKCQKCYVCSETDLQKAEIFRGVIFCAGCAKRIFRGCTTARVAKAPHRRGRRHHRRHRTAHPRAIEHSVIERARAANSSSSSSHRAEESDSVAARPIRDLSVSRDCYCVSNVLTQGRKLINYIYFQSHNLMKSDKPGLVHLNEVYQRMLEDRECCQSGHKPGSALLRVQPINFASNHKDSSDKSSTTMGTSRKLRTARVGVRRPAAPCSDLRIAELGASTEIATMALRKNSRKTVQSEQSTIPIQKTKTLETLSMFSNLHSAEQSETSNEESLDSECQDYRGSKSSVGDIQDRHTVASIVKLPYKYFKKNILQRSSLISVIAGIEPEKEFCKNLKTIFHEDDVLKHQRSGYRKLYSTINKINKKTSPYKFGWPELDGAGERKSSPKNKISGNSFLRSNLGNLFQMSKAAGKEQPVQPDNIAPSNNGLGRLLNNELQYSSESHRPYLQNNKQNNPDYTKISGSITDVNNKVHDPSKRYGPSKYTQAIVGKNNKDPNDQNNPGSITDLNTDVKKSNLRLSNTQIRTIAPYPIQQRMPYVRLIKRNIQEQQNQNQMPSKAPMGCTNDLGPRNIPVNNQYYEDAKPNMGASTTIIKKTIITSNSNKTISFESCNNGTGNMNNISQIPGKVQNNVQAQAHCPEVNRTLNTVTPSTVPLTTLNKTGMSNVTQQNRINNNCITINGETRFSCNEFLLLYSLIVLFKFYLS